MTYLVSRRTIAIAVAAGLVAAGLMAASGSSRAKQSDGSGGRTVAHHAAGKAISSGAIQSQAPTARLFRVGRPTAEPTLGISKDGAIYYSALESNTRVDVMRSADGGRNWDIVSPTFPNGRNAHLLSLDPYVFIDEWTQRIFTIDLTVACSYLSFTDDIETGWTTNPIACGRPVNDHQTLFGGPPVSSSPIGYDNLVYYCWNDVATSSCSKSLDGGITWSVTGSPAFLGLDPETQGDCGGLHGHGVVGDDGTIYLPKEHCGQPWLSISRDEGATWEHVRVSKGNAVWGPDPSVAVDKKGNIYYVHLDEDRMPYVVTSTNGGKKWSKPHMFAYPGLTETVHATVDAGKPGSFAVAYYGTDDVKGKIEKRKYTQEVEWNGFITISDNVLDENPVFFSGSVNDMKDPFARGECGPRRCYDAVDFIDVVISRAGFAYGAFADSCTGPCVGPKADATQTSGVVGALFGGPKLN